MEKIKRDICNYNDCEVTQIIMKYLDSFVQLCSNRIENYNINMRTTKCLNTAVILTYLLSGKENILNIEYCDVQNIKDRYNKLENNEKKKILSKQILNNLKQDLEKKENSRYFYYILITNNMMDKSDKLNDSKPLQMHFPGHVFILDKYLDKNFCQNNNTTNSSKNIKYKIYQSYINKYDLKGYYRKNNNSMDLNKNYNMNINNLINGFENIILNEKQIWNEEAVNFWNKLTFVNTNNLINYKTNQMYICYQKIEVKNCYKKILSYLNYELNILYKYIIEKNEEELKKYIIKNQDVNDEFFVLQKTPYKLYLSLLDAHNEIMLKLSNLKN
jgi:hypothetical protein